MELLTIIRARPTLGVIGSHMCGLYGGGCFGEGEGRKIKPVHECI